MTEADVPTIVILSASAGSGHTKAADSLNLSLEQLLPGWEVYHENIGDHVGPAQRWAIERGWELFSVTRGLRFLYSRFYKFIVSAAPLARLFRRLVKPAASSLEAKFALADVRIVIALHPAAVLAASHWRTRSAFTFYTVCTDLVVHGLHYAPNADRIFCDRRATLLLATDGRAGQSRLNFSGLPTLGPCANRMSGTEREGSDFDLLVSFGAKGILGKRNIRAILRCIEARRLSAVIVCGENRALRAYADRLIAELQLQQAVQCYGYVDDLMPLLRATKIVVGKPGGITTGEAMWMNRQFVIVDRLPGQERYNADALLRSGMGITCKRGDLNDCVDRALKNYDEGSIVPFRSTGQNGISEISDVIVSDIRGAFYESECTGSAAGSTT